MNESEILKKEFNLQGYLSPIQYVIFKTLEKIGPVTRRELAKKLEIPRTTIYDNLIKLQKRKLIEKYSRNNGRRGRPLTFWKLSD